MAKHKVTFEPAGKTIEVDDELYPYGDHGQPGSLLDIALSHGVALEAACGGMGSCGTCHVLVTEGEENLSEPDDDELDMIDQIPGNALQSRLACQAVVGGDVTVTIPGRNRNYVGESG